MARRVPPTAGSARAAEGAVGDDGAEREERAYRGHDEQAVRHDEQERVRVAAEPSAAQAERHRVVREMDDHRNEDRAGDEARRAAGEPETRGRDDAHDPDAP